MKKTRLILSHSTATYIRLNINQLPVNVGLPIELRVVVEGLSIIKSVAPELPELNRKRAIELAEFLALSLNQAASFTANAFALICNPTQSGQQIGVIYLNWASRGRRKYTH